MKEKKLLRALGNVDNQYIKEAEPMKKTNTVFQEICRHEMLGDFSADKYLNLENLQKSS